MGLSLRFRLPTPYLALGALSLLAAGAFGALYVYSRPAAGDVRRDVVRETLDALHDRRDREAQLLAESLLRDPDLEFEALGVPSYVLGMVSVREAELATIPRQRKLLYMIAANYLEQAASNGFPEGEVDEGEYWLAYSLKSAGRRVEAIRAIRTALKRETPREAELKLLLADSLLNDTPRSPQAAFELLSTVPVERLIELGPQWGRQAVRTQLDALMAREDYAGMETYLRSLPPDLLSPAEIRLAECRSKIVKAKALAKKGPQGEDEARSIASETGLELAAIVEGDLPDFRDVSERMYLIAVAQRIADDEPAAWELFEKISELGTTESLPATLEAARMLGQSGQDDAMIETYRRAVGLVGEPTQFANPWVTVEDLQKELRETVDTFRAREQWAHAAELSTILHPVFDQGEALRVQAEVLRDWGQRLLASAEQAPPGEEQLRADEGREKLRDAGETFAKLAEVRFAEADYVQDRLAAGDAYFRGNAFREAIRQYLACLEYAPRNVEPDATLGLGRSLLALGHEEEALPYLTRIESDFPTHPTVYAARYWAAMAFLEIGDLDAAATRLEANLYESELTPDSRDWRDALFQFGDVQYRKGLALQAKADESVDSTKPEDIQLRQRLTAEAENALMQAIRTYEEAAVRFPEDDRNLEVRYALAVAWRTLAETPRAEIAKTDIEITRAAMVQKMKERLSGALPWYEGIYRDLIGKKDDGSLRRNESTLLRNVTFAKADVLYDLGHYQQAIDAYASASNQYHNQPEALEALAQMARCYREMGRVEEARGKIAQAKDLLARMPEDTDFAKTTRGTRAEWITMLDLLGQF
jgi:tetratricopeptide (TPR) repeat protein